MTDTTSASIVICLPPDMPVSDPRTSETERRRLHVTQDWDDTTIGIVGWSSGGDAAVAIAAQHPELARLVLVAVPFDPSPDDGDLLRVKSKTLLLYGSADPATGSKHGSLWQRHLPNARLEMVPGGGHDLLGLKWPRILSHLAPGRLT